MIWRHLLLFVKSSFFHFRQSKMSVDTIIAIRSTSIDPSWGRSAAAGTETGVFTFSPVCCFWVKLLQMTSSEGVTTPQGRRLKIKATLHFYTLWRHKASTCSAEHHPLGYSSFIQLVSWLQTNQLSPCQTHFYCSKKFKNGALAIIFSSTDFYLYHDKHWAVKLNHKPLQDLFSDNEGPQLTASRM